MTTFYRYPLPITTALEDYHQKHGHYPAIVLVNRANLTAAQALGKAPVEPSGGCLASEVWLAVPSDSKRSDSNNNNNNNNGGSAPAQLALF